MAGRAAELALTGRTLAGRFVIGEMLAEGLASAVFACADLSQPARPLVVKILLPLEPTCDLVRLAREARPAWLAHPNIARVFDFGEEEEICYVVMERLFGRTLEALVAERGPLEPEDAVEIFAQLTSALSAVHEVGLVHRDVKPSNVLVAIEPGGAATAKLIDFGVCAHVGARGAVGTRAYMAPEQASDEPVDGRADLYALGVCLYEALTGVRAGAPRSYAALFGPIDRVIPDVRGLRPDVPVALAALVARATLRDPGLRFASAAEMQRALETAVRAPTRSGLRPSPRERADTLTPTPLELATRKVRLRR